VKSPGVELLSHLMFAVTVRPDCVPRTTGWRLYSGIWQGFAPFGFDNTDSPLYSGRCNTTRAERDKRAGRGWVFHADGRGVTRCPADPACLRSGSPESHPQRCI